MTDINLTATTATKRYRRMARKPELGAATEPRAAVKLPTKAAMVEAMLQGAEGVSLAELCSATGWLPHSCRAFLTGLRKKGWALEKFKRDDGVMAYRFIGLSRVPQKSVN